MQVRKTKMNANGQSPLAILLAIIATTSFSSVAQAETVATPGSKSSPAILPTHSGSSDQISLSDLRDVGLCVMQIKQQAINIYLEVTRKPIIAKTNAEMPDPMTISVHGLEADAKYLPTRPEWLTFYVGTMEPIIHLFKEDIKDAESGVQKITVTKGTKDKFEKVFDAYETAVEQLNVHLTAIYNQIDEPGNNVKIAKEAIKIFELAEELEKDRQQAYVLIQTAEGAEVEQFIPTKKTD